MLKFRAIARSAKSLIIHPLRSLAFLLAIVIVGLWIRSHFANDRFERSWLVSSAPIPSAKFDTRSRVCKEWSVSSGRGILAVVWSRMNDETAGGDWPEFFGSLWISEPPRSPVPRSFGFEAPEIIPAGAAANWGFWHIRAAGMWDGLMPARYHSITGVAVPYWCLLGPVVLFILIPQILRRQSVRRGAQGLCSACHYDLRAHHPGDKCPECGTPIPANHATIKAPNRST